MSNFEGFKSRTTTTSIATTMTSAMRDGDFSLVPTVLQDPLTRAGTPPNVITSPYPGNKVPSNRFDKSSVYLMSKFFPLPNLPAAPGLPLRNYQYLTKTPVDKVQFNQRIDFNGREGKPGLFHRFAYETGYANGLVSVQFDPDYRRNGRFYTVHIEDPSVDAPLVPDPANTPGLNVRGYEPTKAISPPGEILRDGVLIEWTDTNIGNTTFEGSARELMRVQLNTRIHPLGDLVFNPAARAGDPDWRVLYVGCGDGGSGESRQAIRTNPQRLDTMVGKIHRIIPDLKAHESSSVVSENVSVSDVFRKMSPAAYTTFFRLTGPT